MARRKSYSSEWDALIGIGIYLSVYLATALTLGGMSVSYLVSFWTNYFTHTHPDVPFYACAIAGLFVSSISIPLALCTWVLSFVL